MTNNGFSAPIRLAPITPQQCNQALEVVKPVVVKAEPQLKEGVKNLIIDSFKRTFGENIQKPELIPPRTSIDAQFGFRTKEEFGYRGTISFGAERKGKILVLNSESFKFQGQTAILKQSSAFGAYLTLVRRPECRAQHAQYTKLKDDMLQRAQQGGFDSAMAGLGMIKGGSPTSPLRFLPKKSK